MKIIFTSHTYYPRKDGVQFVTQYLAEGLAKKGYEVVVFTNHDVLATDIKTEEHNGVKIYRIDAHTKHTIHYGNKDEYINMLKSEITKDSILINCCSQCATTDWLLPILEEIKIPKVLYLHSIWDFKIRKQNLASIKTFLAKIWANLRWSLYYKKYSNKFKLYDVVTQLHSMDYATAFFKEKFGINSVIIENAAEDVFFTDYVDSNIELPEKYIINVSNYSKVKNQIKCLDLFLKADISEEWEFIFIGSKKNFYYDKLEKMYSSYLLNGGTKKVRFLYNIPREHVNTYVKKSSLYFMASVWEAFPISLVESCACSVPFICSNVGIVRFLPGGVVCSNDIDYLYWLKEFTSNAELRAKYGKLGKDNAISKYSVSAKVNQLEKVLLDLYKED